MLKDKNGTVTWTVNANCDDCDDQTPTISDDWELKVQDDGNVVLYSPLHGPLWSTKTSNGVQIRGNPRYEYDKNVLYKQDPGSYKRLCPPHC